MQNFKNHLFADCDSRYEDARYVMFGVPFDGTTTFRAVTRDGPRAIREFSWNFETYMPSYDLNFADIPVTDLGDIDIGVVAEDVVSEVYAAVQRIVNDKKIPVMLGGEHSITTGAVRAVRPVCYVVCDAHLDLREEFRGTQFNHACTTRRVLEDGIKDIIIVGGRSGTKDQFELAKTLTLYTADEIHRRGMSTVLDEIRDAVGKKRVYLSIDADAIDCCLTPGLGTPEPFGLTPEDIRDLIRVVAPHTVAFDYVEVSPFDHGQTATVAAQLVREFVAAHMKFSQKNNS
jgi:agmatinase